MTNFTEEKIKELLRNDNRKICGSCSQRLWSPFDVLFMHTYSICLDCIIKEKSDKEIEKMSEPIFQMINNL